MSLAYECMESSTFMIMPGFSWKWKFPCLAFPGNFQEKEISFSWKFPFPGNFQEKPGMEISISRKSQAWVIAMIYFTHVGESRIWMLGRTIPIFPEKIRYESCQWVMSYTSRSRVSHMNAGIDSFNNSSKSGHESCRTCQGAMTYVWKSHISYINAFMIALDSFFVFFFGRKNPPRRGKNRHMSHVVNIEESRVGCDMTRLWVWRDSQSAGERACVEGHVTHMNEIQKSCLFDTWLMNGSWVETHTTYQCDTWMRHMDESHVCLDSKQAEARASSMTGGAFFFLALSVWHHAFIRMPWLPLVCDVSLNTWVIHESCIKESSQSVRDVRVMYVRVVSISVWRKSHVWKSNLIQCVT